MDGCRPGAEPRVALLALSLLLGACAAAPGARASSAGAAAPQGRSSVPAQEPARSAAETPSPEQALAQAQALERDVLGLSARAAPDATTRQIATLRQARELYEQFIDHAKNRPEMSDAVERSRERIEDIDQTIDFLDRGAATSDSLGP